MQSACMTDLQDRAMMKRPRGVTERRTVGIEKPIQIAYAADAHDSLETLSAALEEAWGALPDVLECSQAV